MAFSDYQLVLSERKGTPGKYVYSPAVVFTFHASPNSVTYKPRQAIQTTALPGGVLIDASPTILADLHLAISSGLAQSLATDEDGLYNVFDGRQRAQALRKFLANVAIAMSQGKHRLEFHDNDRDRHWQIVPNGATFSISNHDMSRLGGDEVELPFVVVGDLLAMPGILRSIHDGLAAVQSAVSRVTGLAAIALETVRQFSRIPLQLAGLVTSTLDKVSDVIGRLRAIVDFSDVDAAVLSDLRSVNSLCVQVKQTLTLAGDIFSADHWRRLGDSITAMTAATVKLFKASPPRNGTASIAGASGGATSASNFSVVAAALTAGGGSAQNQPVQAFPGLQPRLDAYSGWTPYEVKAGDTLAGIAAKLLGQSSLWVDLAVINDLGADYGMSLVDGQVLKIPMQNGGLPFSLPSSTDIAQFKASVLEFAYLRDLKLSYPRGLAAGADLTINREDPRGFETVTGPANYKQRYQCIVFRTQVGTNPCFEHVGVYLSVGRRRSLAKNLTRVSAQAQLAADPRTLSVVLRKQDYTADQTTVEFDVRTQMANVTLGV